MQDLTPALRSAVRVRACRGASRAHDDADGRLVVVITTGSASIPAGTVFRVLGNALECAGRGVGPRRAERGPTGVEAPRAVECGECRSSFELSARNVRAAQARGEAPRCRACRGISE